jgi:hypothetical protein
VFELPEHLLEVRGRIEARLLLGHFTLALRRCGKWLVSVREGVDATAWEFVHRCGSVSAEVKSDAEAKFLFLPTVSKLAQTSSRG